MTQGKCIEWARAKNQYGYGVLRRNGKNHLAHRVALLDSMGLEKTNLNALHKCDNPGCVNPLHLYLGTQAKNMQDMHERGRAKATGAKTPLRGEAHPGCKLTAGEVRQIRRRRGERQGLLAREFGVVRQTISDIQRFRIWKELD